MADQPKPPKRKLRARVGLTLADGTRVEAGQLVPVKYHEKLPAVWLGTKVEEE